MSDSARHWGHREYMGRGFRRILSEHTVHTVHTVYTVKSLIRPATGDTGSTWAEVIGESYQNTLDTQYIQYTQ